METFKNEKTWINNNKKKTRKMKIEKCKLTIYVWSKLSCKFRLF